MAREGNLLLPAPTGMGILLRITVLLQAGHLNPALCVALSQLAPSEIVSAHSMRHAYAVHQRGRFFLTAA